MTKETKQGLDTVMNQIAELTKQIEAAKATNASLEATNAALRSQLQASQAASAEATQKATQFEAQLTELTAKHNSESQRVEDLTTKLNEMTASATEAMETAGAMTKKVELYRTMASDPKYHAILDIADDLNLPNDIEAAKVVLDKFAGKIESARDVGSQQATDAFKSIGATPPSNGQPTGSNGPTTREEAVAMAMDALNSGDFDRFDALSNQALTLGTEQ